MTVAPKPLAIIPTYLSGAMDLEMVKATLESLRKTAGDRCDLLVVDDGSPSSDATKALGGMTEHFDGEFVAKGRNEGFSKTVNVGLRRALNEGRDAILVNADIEFQSDTWLDLMVRQRTIAGDGLASVVGALLLYPNGLIQHAGIFFSLLYREFDHIYRYGPGNLPEARKARVCPVTGALQFIRHECLEGLGVYDEKFFLGWEDVDYCIRVWQAGRECVYQPGVLATHHESFFRGRPNKKIQDWQEKSWLTFVQKWGQVSFAEFVPSLV